jgi:hypothetical protein
MFLARISKDDYTLDADKIGWLMVVYKGELRWAMPKMRFGAFEMPTKEWVDKYGDLVGVWIVGQTTPDEREKESFLVWDGFTFLAGKVTQEALEDFPYVRMFFTENWTMLFNDTADKNLFKVVHLDGSIIKLDRTKDAESFEVFDAKLGNRQVWNKDGMTVTDAFGNLYKWTKDGALFQDANGNVISMTKEGFKVNDDFVVLKPMLDWLLKVASTFGMGNMSAPVPILPANVTSLNQGINGKKNFVSNK